MIDNYQTNEFFENNYIHPSYEGTIRTAVDTCPMKYKDETSKTALKEYTDIFFITYKQLCNFPEPTVNTYDKCHYKLFTLSTILREVYERDSRGKIHYHAVVLIEKGFYLKRIIIQGMSMKAIPVYDFNDLESYLNKDKLWFKSNYAF